MAGSERLWQDKDTLYELYHGNGLDKKKIGEEVGCSDVTVSNWLQKHGIPNARAWERPSLLRELYVEKRMTQQEIADRLGCDQTTVSRELRKHGISTRKRGDYTSPSLYFSDDGYLTCRHRIGGRDGERVAFRVHRLVAVAEYGFDALDGKVVHHRNKHPADNRPENLELMELAEHTEMHHYHGDILAD